MLTSRAFHEMPLIYVPSYGANGNYVPDIGATLRNARIQRGLSIEQAAQDTRISARFIEALEAERFDSLPAPVYVRGFLRSYASYLRLDPAPLLADLGEGAALRVPAPDSFTTGPNAPRAGAQRSGTGARTDPFRRNTPPAAPLPPPAPISSAPSFEDPEDDEVWATTAPRITVREPTPLSPLSPDDLPAEEARYRRTAGVLAERPVEQEEGGMRVLALAAAGILVLLVALAAAVFITSGDDDDGSVPAGGGVSPTASGTRTVVPVGSATPARSASPAASATGTPGTATATATPGEPTPTPGPGTPTPQPQPTPTSAPGQPTPTPTPETPTPTATSAATPTPTVPPATPTPTIPPPTPTPTIPHPSAYEECQQGNCGDPPFSVVCPPDGRWFVDVGGNFPAPASWPRRTTNSLAAAATVCG